MRATRRLIGLCVALGLTLCPTAGSGIPGDRPARAVRSQAGTPSQDSRDLYFGEALYHAFQGRYFDALQRLDTELAKIEVSRVLRRSSGLRANGSRWPI